MTWQFDGYNYLLRFDKDELLIEGLTKFVREQNIKGGWLSIIGGALWVELGFYDLSAKHYRWKKIDQILEITNAQGTLAWGDEKPFVHLHGTLSDEQMQTYGGHIKELSVGGTCEVFLHVWNKDRLIRGHDEQTGLKLLEL